MKITEIVATVGQKINVGDYENVDFPLTLKGVLDEGDDPDECAKELYKQAEKMWAKQVRTRLMRIRKLRADAEDKGIYKLTGRLFDRAIEPVMGMLKDLLASG